MANRLFYDNTREEICQEWGHWVDGMTDWEWYATLTFRDPEDPRFPGWTRIGWQSALKALRSFHNALVGELDYINPVWVAVGETQQRGTPHWHLLVANVADQRRMSWLDWWFERYGIARVLPYQAELGARYYLGKYLTKQLANIEFSPALYAQLGRT